MTSSYDNARETNGHKSTVFNIRLDLLVCLFLALSILAVYWQVRNHDFVNFDDNLYVTANEHVRSGINLNNVIWAFSFKEERPCCSIIRPASIECGIGCLGIGTEKCPEYFLLDTHHGSLHPLFWAAWFL